jgi:hypothetical protein
MLGGMKLIAAYGPGDGGALGDVEAGGDAREAEALGAEFGELIFNVVAMHGTIFRIVWAKDQTLRWLCWLYWLFLRWTCFQPGLQG